MGKVLFWYLFLSSVLVGEMYVWHAEKCGPYKSPESAEYLTDILATPLMIVSVMSVELFAKDSSKIWLPSCPAATP